MAKVRDSSPLLPRKTPKQSRSAAAVDDVVEAAARILDRDGMGAYNTNAIARLAGFSVGSLYQYFPNKDAITRALILREAKTTLAMVSSVPPTASGAAVVGHVVNVAVERQLARPTLARLIDMEEQRLAVTDDVAPDRLFIEALIADRLTESCGPQPDFVGAELVAIIKVLVDGAGARGETDRADLEARVRRAAFGYIGLG